MIEAELKILLDATALRRLKRDPAVVQLRLEPRQMKTLVSTYYDTPDQALAAAKISLRLRKIGRSWVQTIKRKTAGLQSGGFFASDEWEIPAPGGRLVLEGADPEEAIAAVRDVVGDAPLAPVFETHVRRMIERLRAPEGEGTVELALDEGEIRAGGATEPIREAEMELLSGNAAAVFAVAKTLFPAGPVRFAEMNKAMRGYRLARGEAPETRLKPRGARTLEVAPETSVEAVARDVFRDCLAQIGGNAAVIAGSDAPEGPHQMRIGLRRLRTAFALFGGSLGTEAMAPLGEVAQQLGQTIGAVRDADVLHDEVVTDNAEGLDPAARAALDAVLAARRDATRREVRTALAGPAATAFLFDLGAFIEARGWLAPSDYSQTGRLAKPIGELAPELLQFRQKRVKRRGRQIRELDAEGLHALRKELKKLRYAVDMLGPLYEADRVAPYLKSLKELQDAFGSLNDAAMAEEKLAGADAPAPRDPDAQRAVGWVLGRLALRAVEDRPALFERWDRLAGARPFWR